MKKKHRIIKIAAVVIAIALITGGAGVCGRKLIKHYGALLEQAYEKMRSDIEQGVESLKSRL